MISQRDREGPLTQLLRRSARVASGWLDTDGTRRRRVLERNARWAAEARDTPPLRWDTGY